MWVRIVGQLFQDEPFTLKSHRVGKLLDSEQPFRTLIARG
jgi:hypothetical protein